MKRPGHLSVVASLVLALVSCGCAHVGSVGPPREATQSLARVRQAVQATLDAMDEDLARVAKTVGETGLDSAKAREALASLCRKHPYMVDCGTVDAAGKIVAVEPEAYRDAEGSDISKQEQVVRLHETHEPVLSKMFVAVEGFPAVVLQCPVFSPSNEFIGCVSMLIKPAQFLDQIIRPAVKGRPWDCWVMQTDGWILYDPDPEELGRNVLTDDMYAQFTELVRLAKRMSQEPEGFGSYRFLGIGMDRPVQKDCRWTTTALHGTQWRIALAWESE